MIGNTERLTRAPRQRKNPPKYAPANALLWRFLDLKDKNIVSNRMTLSRWIRGGIFPKPVRIGGIVAWRAADVQHWLDERAAASQNGEAA